MPEFYYQIKGKSKYGGWDWPPLVADKIEAKDKKQAKELIEELHDKTFTRGKGELLLHIREIAGKNSHIHRLFKTVNCKKCGNEFRLIDKYMIGNEGGGSEYCSGECWKEAHEFGEYRIDYGSQKPIIYKITNKQTEMCYIGKTTQIFTLRWYQHFFQTGTTKFHQAITNTSVCDWVFEILEVIEFPEGCNSSQEKAAIVFNKETEYIKRFNSIEKGYNSVTSIKQDITDDDKGLISMFENEIITNSSTKGEKQI